MLKEERLEWRTCYKLDALLDGQKLIEIGQKNLNATDGPEDMPQMAELDDLTVYFWVDKKSRYIAGLEADLAPMTQKLLADSPFEGEMTVARYTINLRNTDFDAVEDFQIPPEALEAEDMENPFPLLPF